MNSFNAELKHRNVFKVGMADAIVTCSLIQIPSTALPLFDISNGGLMTNTFIIIPGYPLELFLTRAHELTSDGIKPSSSVIRRHGPLLQLKTKPCVGARPVHKPGLSQENQYGRENLFR